MQVTIGANEYLIDRLPPKKAWHVVRRIFPVIAGSAPMIRQLIAELQGEGGGDMFAAIGPLAEAISALKDEDSDYVMDACLSACKRRSGAGWSAVQTNAGLMFQDITLAQQLQLVFAVLKENLFDFLGELRGQFPGQAAEAALNM